ncbi:pancreatic triacylglycerol lipase-like [Prorops nasuta]|uniref:pancreatic triacylglycerol lipase-like n=1 Tax=Prorops nasuta TaxID=863751 RepID=UPI0034CE8F0D
MRLHFLIGFLLVCLAAGLPVDTEEPNGILTAADFDYFADKEFAVYDDNGNLVTDTLDAGSFELLTQEDYAEEIIDRNMEKRIMFLLYTDKNKDEAQPLYLNNDEVLLKSNFDPSKPTRLVTHGWMNSRKSAACTLIRDGYLRVGGYNVIVVDWSKISCRGYVYASSRVQQVGIFVSRFINFLARHGMDISDTTLIGHSLGAHVMGMAGYYSNHTVNYIYGLDPALPGFLTARQGSRISRGDAHHVEIIHTNAGLLGYFAAIGDIDFYPNGGSRQYGCLIDPGGACSHARSYEFFAESINSKTGFYGRSCYNFIQYTLGLCKRKELYLMGGRKVTIEKHGTFYLTTTSKNPYAKGIV